MTRMKKPVVTKADDKTREYILGLMRTLPQELFELVGELRGITETVRRKTDRLDQDAQAFIEDLGKLATRLDALEDVVRELCDTAAKAVAIGPLWDVMRDVKKD